MKECKKWKNQAIIDLSVPNDSLGIPFQSPEFKVQMKCFFYSRI